MKLGLSVVLFVSAPFWGSFTASANPVGGAVQAGTATISQKGPWLTVNQGSDKVIIDWNSFSIGAGEVTRFIQPGANSAALNRVLGGNPTQIYGLLQGNGQVFVINPAGILVGRSGVINTHSFAGSTLDVNDASFLSGVGLRFSGNSTAGVRNEGSIQALGGDIYLFAHKVENAGSITAPGGTVGLAAGSEIVLSQTGNEHVSVLAGNIQAAPTATGVDNAGAIQAASAELKAAGGNIYALAINNGGIVRATTIVNQGGHIYLRAGGGNIQNTGVLAADGNAGNGGKVVVDGGHNAAAPSTVVNSGAITARGDAPNGQGGTVEVMGDHVGLFDHSVLDVSGQSGGGTALVGGGFHGSNPEVQNSQITYVGPGASIKADALSSGNGGNVAVWSDSLTRFYGNISDRGGEASGNGGFVETSGKLDLDVSGAMVDGRAAHGAVGKWLLDPTTINVVSTDPGDGSFTSTLSDVAAFNKPDVSNPLNLSSIDVASINGAQSSVTLQAKQDINFNASVNITKSGVGLTAQAGNNINVNDSIATTGGKVTLSGNDAGGPASGTGSVTLKAGITTQGGDIDIKGPANVGATVTLDSGGGKITFESSLDGANALTLTAGAGNLSLQTVGSKTPLSSLSASGGAFTLGGPITAGALTLSSSAAVTVPALTISGDLNITAGGDIKDSAAVSVTGNTTLTAGSANNISFTHADTFGGSVSIVSGKDVTLTDSGPLGLGASTISGGLTVTAGGSIGESGLVSVVGASQFTVTAASSDVSLGGFANVFGGGVTLAVSGGSIHDVTIRDAATTPSLAGLPAALNNLTLTYDKAGIAVPAVAVGGNLNVSAGGDISDSGNVSVAGNTTLVAPVANNITFNHADTFGGPVTIVSGKDVTLINGSPTVFGASTISGKLDVTSGGSVTGNGLLSVGGPTKLTLTGANSDILLGVFANVFSGGVTLALSGGSIHDVLIHDAAPAASLSGLPATLNNLTLQYENAGVTLPAINVTGSLSVTANGPISDSGNISVTGNTSLSAGAGNNISFTHADDFTSPVSINSAKDVSINEVGALTLGASDISGNLTITASGLVHDTGNLTVNGTTTVTAGPANNVTFSQADDFGGAVSIVSGKDVTLNDVNALILGASTISGGLTVTANGLISDSGAVSVSGATSLSAGTPNNINLSQADSFVGPVTIVNGKDVSLNSVGGLTLAASTISGGLTITAKGPISDSGNVSVSGATSLSAGSANNITFSQADTFSGPVTIVNGNDVTLVDSGPLTLGPSTISGKLNVTAGGSIGENGVVSVTGASQFTVSAAASDVLLGGFANVFNGGVTLAVSGPGTIHDVAIHDAATTPSLTGLPAALNNLTLSYDKAGISVPAVAVGGNLNIAASGDISDAGNVTVAGSTTLTAPAANNITFNHVDSFAGPITIVSGKDVTLANGNATVFGASTISGKLDVTSGGSVTGNGLLSVGGPSTFTLTGPNSDILLGVFANVFSGGVTLALSGGTIHDVAIHDAAPTPSLSGLPATLNNLTLQYDNAGVTLPAVNVTGSLSVTANGPIADSGNISVTGNTSLSAGAANNITFSHADDFISPVSINSAKDVSINEVNGLTLGATHVSGNLTITANGLVHDSGNLTVNGTTTVTAGTANNVTFTQADDFGGAVSIVSGKDVSLNDVNALILGASGISGGLTVTANGPITDSGALLVSGATSLAAGTPNNITLSQADSFAGGVSILNGKDVSLNSVNGLTLGASSISGNLTVTAKGPISDSGNVSVSGATSLSAGSANNITFSQADTFGGPVSIVNGNDVTLVDNGPLVLGASSISGKLNVTAAGSISENGLVSVGGASQFTVSAANSDVLLGGFANLFNGGVTLAVSGPGTIHDVAIRDAAATPSLTGLPAALNNLTLSYDNAGISVPAVAVGGNLAVTANGPISDSGNVTVVGNTTLTAPAANNITFTHADDFGGPVSVVSGKDVTLVDANAIVLGASTISGKLDVTAGGSISENGLLSVAGPSSFTLTGANTDILLGGFANLFGGGVTLAVSGAGTIHDVALRDASATPSLTGLPTTLNNLTLQYDNAGVTVPAVNVAGNLSVTANGPIADSGNVTVVGTTTLAAGAANNINFSHADDFGIGVSIVSGKDVTLNDVNGLTLGVSTISGNLTITATGDISDNGNITVAGATSLAAGPANNITFGKADDFVGPVSIVSGKDVALADINTINLGASSISGKLDVTAGGVSQSGLLNVAGPSTFTITAAGGDVLLAGFANVFNGGVALAVSGPGTLHDVALRDASPAPTLTGLPASLNNLTLQYDNAGIALPAETLTGNLVVSANGPITDNGNVVVAGTTTLAAGPANNITLNHADDFGGAVTITSGKDVSLFDVNTIALGASTISGKLDVTAGGSISEAGALTVTGPSTFTLTAANTDVLLGGFANLFNGGVTLAVSGAGTIHDVALRDASATPSLIGLPASLNNLTLQYDNAGIALPAETLTGNLAVTANGPISDSGNVVVAGTTALAAGAANNITFNHADDFGGAVSILSGKDVTLVDINAISLGASTVSGGLNVTAGGNISETGLLTITGPSTFTLTGAASDVSLGGFANLFNGGVSLAVSGAGSIHDVLLRDASATPSLTGLPAALNNLSLTYDNAGIAVPAVNVAGNLNVTANGPITDSGNVAVIGTTTLTAGSANNITFSHADDFGAAVSIVSGKNVTLNDINGLTLGASSISGNLAVTANGLISDSGNLTVAGTTGLSATGGNDINLTKADDFVGPVSIGSANNATLVDVNTIALGASTISGKLDVTAGGVISETGLLNIGGSSKFTVTAASSDVLMAGFANLFNGGVTLAVSGAGTLHDVAIRDASAAPSLIGLPSALNNLTLQYDNAGIALPTETLTGNLTVSAKGPITDNGNVVVAGTTSLTAGSANNITLTHADDFVGPVAVVSGKDVTLNDINALTFGASTISGNLTATANGLISDNAKVTVAGTTSLAAGAGNNIKFSQADDFGGAVSIVNGKDVSLNDVNALTLGASAVSGNLTLIANGPVSDSGKVTVAGSTSVAAGAGNNITFSQADDFVGPVSIVSGKDVSLNDVNALTLGASTVSGNLTVTANGLISDSGKVTVAGNTSLAAGAANNITFSQADDFAGPVSIVNGKDVSLNDINALTLAASTVSGNLTITANGVVSDSGNVTVAGATSLSAGAGNNITFSKADDFVGPVSIVSGKDVALNDVNALTVGASSVSGNLTITASGQVSDSGKVTVAGATSLAAGTANNITFSQADDFVGPVSIVSGKNVTLNDINTLTLGASTVSGNLAVTANGLLSDSGNVTVAGSTSLAAGAGNNITFSKADDFVGPVSIVNGKDVSLNDINALTLGASTISGNLTVTANGLVSDSGKVTVAGATSLAAGAANNITFSQADDFVGPVSIISGKDVSLNDINALALGASTVSGNLTITANGLVSDSGKVTVAGTTSLAAGAANNITFSQADDFVGPVSIVSGNNVSLNDINALTLGASTVSGNLTVTANGLVSDSGKVTVSGATSLAAGAANNITFSQADDFVGPVSIVSGKDVSLNDINALTLGASTVAGNLTVTANGLVSDSGKVTVAGTTSLAAGAANNITLSQADDFVGPVSIVSGKDVALNDVNALTLGASTVSGNLTVTANGLVSDSGKVTVAGTTSLAAGAANNITLSQADDFVGPVSVVSGNNVSLNDVNSLTLGASTVAGNLTVTANGLVSDSGKVTVAGATSLAAGTANNITFSQADDFVGPVSIVSGNNVSLNDINALTLGASTVAGNLALTANGPVSDSGKVTVAGTTSLAAGAANNITFSQADDFVGAVSIVSGKDVSLNDINALTLGASTISGNLTVKANGLVSDSGKVTVAGATSLAAGTGNNITFSQADDFVGPVSIVSGNNVSLNDINALTLGASSVSGNLTVTANGLVSDSGKVTVAGSTSLAAGSANNITFSQADDFVGPVSIVSGKDVTLNDINALTFGASSISGNLTVTANGLVSDSGKVTVAGSTSLAAGAGNNINFSQADDFVGPVSVVSGKDVSLNDINALTLGGSTVAGNLTLTTAGPITDSGKVTVSGGTSLAAGTGNNITFSQADDFVGPVSIVSGKDVSLNDINALTLGASTVSGNLTITASGLVSDSGKVTVAGSTSLAAGSANNITFGQADDFVGPVSIVSGKDVSLNDINALTLGASTVSGNLAITANGLISDSGNVTVAGATSLAAGAGNNITFSKADDFVGPVSVVSGKDVSLNDINALTLGASTVSGNLTVTANGLVSDSGKVTVAGATSLAAGTGNNITFSQADDFVGPVSIVSGKNVSLNDINALTLGASTVSGNLTITANGLVSDSGNVTVAGSTSLAAGAGNNITFSKADDFVGPVSIVSGKDVSLNDINALTLGASTVSGNLTVTANGLVSDSGKVTVAGATSLAAGAGNNITFSQADDFVGPVSIVSGKDVSLNDINSLTLGASTISGNLTLTANGPVSDSGKITVAGATSVAAGAGNNVTFSQADDFVGPVTIVSGKDVTLNDINALTLGAGTVSGNLSVTANGPITDSGNVTVDGATSLAAGVGNNITLSKADDFVGPVSIVSGKDVSLNDINALTLGASTVSGNLTITANGLVSDSGNVTVAGSTSLAAGAGNNIAFSKADDFVGPVSIVSGKDVSLNDINALTLGASTVSGNLSVTANGLVSDSGNVSVAGATSLAAGAANNITFSKADDFVGPVSIVSGKDVSLNDINALTLGASAVSGNLTITANGLVSDSGNVTVAGATSLSAGAANNISFSKADDFGGPVSIVSGKDVSLNDINALTLGASSVSGNLTVTANGLVSDSGNVTVAGATSLAAGIGNNITFSQADDFVGPVSIVSGKDVSLNDINALTLGASTVSGNLTVTANGLVSDSGNVTVAGATSLAAGAGNNITFSQADDFVGPVSIVSGKDVSLNDINALTLGASTVSGNLTITASGLVSDSGKVTVAGSTSLTAGAGNNITFSQPDDFVGPVSVVSGKDVSLNDVNALTLGASTVSGNLAITANGLVSDSGKVTVAGSTSLAAGAGNNITFSQADDFVGPVSIVSGKDVSLNDINALTLGASTISGNLTVTANGLVSDSGVVTVAGTTSLAAGAGNNITFSQADDFVGPVSIVSGRDVSLNDVNALTLGASSISGNLAVTANGLINDSGNVTVAGATSLAAGAGNNITFSQADDFVGPVSIVSGKDVSLNDINALTLGASTVSGNLALTANGLVSDSGNVTVAGNTTVTAGAANNITFSHADDFVGSVSIVSGKDVSLNDVNALVLGPSTVSGNLTITANGLVSDSGNLTVAGNTSVTAGSANNITFSQADDFVGPVSVVSGNNVSLNDVNALTLGASTISGNLTVTANGLVSDSGKVTVAGATSLAAGSVNDITFSQADDFAGPVSIVSGRNVTLNDINALTLGASAISGNLVITANGLVSDSGNLTVAGSTSVAAGAANSIQLSQADDFVGPVSIVSGKDVSLNDINALTLGASTVSGKLTVTANGLISDSGKVSVAGATSLAAGTANNITFSQADDFVGPVSIVSGNNVSLNDINALTLGASVVSGNLAVTANGLVSDSGNLVINGSTTIAAGSANNIALSHGDDFVGPVSIVSGNDVALNDINSINLGASTVSGNLNVTAAGPITQSGTVTVNHTGKTASFSAPGNNITLLNANNDFSTLKLAGADVAVNDANALDLGASTITGDLTVATAGAITQSGAIVANGNGKTASFTAPGQNITLNGNNDFATVRFTGGDVSLNDVNALDLGAGSASGNLTVSAGGPITQSGALVANGAGKVASFTSSGNSITLGNANNDFTTAKFVGTDVTVNDLNALDLGDSHVFGNFTVTANGALTQSGVITANNPSTKATFTVGPGNDVTLDQANDFVSVAVPSANNVTLNDVNGFTLSAVGAAGTLSLNTRAGDIVQALDGTVVKAKTLTGIVNGQLILGNPANASANPGDQFVAAPQPPNEIGSIESLVHNGELYVFNSRTVHYGSLLNPGEIANPLPLQDPAAVLGLKITGPVSGQGLTVIRTAGDLVLLGNGRVTTTEGDIELSAESSATVSGNFHNLAGTIAADGTPLPDLAHGSIAVQAGTDFLNHKPGSTQSRFLIFSTDAKQNFGEQFNGAKLTFNGLGADFIADQISFGDHRSPIVKQNAQPDSGFGNGFVFVQKQAVLQTDETAKFFFDLLSVTTVAEVNATARLGNLPPERPPTIWTSSYHVYLEEQEKKKKKHSLAELPGPIFATAILAGE